MLINKKYDSSLWLILSGDKKNKAKIINFISSIPSYIYDDIKKSFNKFSDKKHNISASFRKKNILYMYTINAVTGELCISKCVYNKCRYEQIYMLSLFPYVGISDVKKRKILISRFLYANGIDNESLLTLDGDKIEYKLVLTPFGMVLKKYSEYEPIIQTNYMLFDRNIREIDLCYDFEINRDKKRNLIFRRKDSK